MKSWSQEFTSQLLEAKNSQEFLASFFSDHTPFKNFSYQVFAKRSGYSTKSYISEVISGKKKLSLSSVDKFSKGLALNLTWKDYLETLVRIDLSVSTLDRKHLIQKLDKLKNKLNLKNKSRNISESLSQTQKLLLSPLFPEVYASLGDSIHGSDLTTIEKRTKLEKPEIKNILIELVNAQIVRTEGDRYIVNTDAIDFSFIDTPEYFKADFFRSLDKARNRFINQSNSNNSLFMTQTFSVQSNDLPELRKKLESVIFEFSQNSENSNGDTVADINISFSHC